MFQKWLSWLWDTRGEVDGDNSNGDADSSGNSGQADGNQGDSNTDGQNGQSGDSQNQAAPKYGEFGDIPKTQEEAVALIDKLYGEYGKFKPMQSEYGNLKQKQTLTERNLASLRKSLEASGIKAVQDNNGNVRFDLIGDQSNQRQRKFQDVHRAKFSPEIIEAIDFFVSDKLDDFYSSREKETTERQRIIQLATQAKQESNDLMLSYFPQLQAKFDSAGKPTNPDFNQTFYDRATEIWQEKYSSDPRGELLAALTAAKELNILPQLINQARADGVKAGKENKKILSPVQGSGQKAAVNYSGITKEEYFKLSPEERIKADEALIKQRSGGK